MITTIFWISVAVVLYVYIGYPMIISVIGLLKPKKIRKRDIEPKVSILIAAYNEEDCIAKTIENKLALDYPEEKYDIIVVSDGSDDRTDEIVQSFKEKKVTLIRQEPRAGKTSALNMAVEKAGGDILVFSDANSMYERTALKKLIANFADQDVGYVTGTMIYTNPDGTIVGDGCSAYMKYENFLRSAETRIGSVVGVDGGIDAVRKSAYRTMNPDQLPDFVLPLMVAAQGYRVVYEPDAILKEPSLKSTDDEYRMRVRVTLRALWALFDMRQLLFSRHHGLFAWQLWSHKLLRYLCFAFLIAIYVGNLFILNSPFYVMFFVCQTFFYLIAGFNHKIEKKWRSIGLFRYINYFALINLSALHAFVKFMANQKQIVWTPRKG